MRGGGVKERLPSRKSGGGAPPVGTPGGFPRPRSKFAERAKAERGSSEGSMGAAAAAASSSSTSFRTAAAPTTRQPPGSSSMFSPPPPPYQHDEPRDEPQPLEEEPLDDGEFTSKVDGFESNDAKLASMSAQQIHEAVDEARDTLGDDTLEWLRKRGAAKRQQPVQCQEEEEEEGDTPEWAKEQPATGSKAAALAAGLGSASVAERRYALSTIHRELSLPEGAMSAAEARKALLGAVARFLSGLGGGSGKYAREELAHGCAVMVLLLRQHDDCGPTLESELKDFGFCVRAFASPEKKTRDEAMEICLECCRCSSDCAQRIDDKGAADLAARNGFDARLQVAVAESYSRAAPRFLAQGAAHAALARGDLLDALKIARLALYSLFHETDEERSLLIDMGAEVIVGCCDAYVDNEALLVELGFALRTPCDFQRRFGGHDDDDLLLDRFDEARAKLLGKVKIPSTLSAKAALAELLAAQFECNGQGDVEMAVQMCLVEAKEHELLSSSGLRFARALKARHPALAEEVRCQRTDLNAAAKTVLDRAKRDLCAVKKKQPIVVKKENSSRGPFELPHLATALLLEQDGDDGILFALLASQSQNFARACASRLKDEALGGQLLAALSQADVTLPPPSCWPFAALASAAAGVAEASLAALQRLHFLEVRGSQYLSAIPNGAKLAHVAHACLTTRLEGDEERAVFALLVEKYSAAIGEDDVEATRVTLATIRAERGAAATDDALTGFAMALTTHTLDDTFGDPLACLVLANFLRRSFPVDLRRLVFTELGKVNLLHFLDDALPADACLPTDADAQALFEPLGIALRGPNFHLRFVTSPTCALALDIAIKALRAHSPFLRKCMLQDMRKHLHPDLREHIDMQLLK